MNVNIKLYDVVVLIKDLPSRKLGKGTLGAIIEILDHHVFLVEFADKSGRTYALETLKAPQLLKVKYEPMAA